MCLSSWRQLWKQWSNFRQVNKNIYHWHVGSKLYQQDSILFSFVKWQFSWLIWLQSARELPNHKKNLFFTVTLKIEERNSNYYGIVKTFLWQPIQKWALSKKIFQNTLKINAVRQIPTSSSFSNLSCNASSSSSLSLPFFYVSVIHLFNNSSHQNGILWEVELCQ